MMRETESRKADHIRVCLEEDVSFRKKTGLETIELVHRALPETAMKDISMRTGFLGKEFRYPLFIESMTGGTRESRAINQNLASAAQELGIGMGVGSIRAALEDPSLESTYQVRGTAPDIFLLSNLGAAQIAGMDIQKVRKAVEMIKADGLFVHLNAAQEAFQHNGDLDWTGVLKKIGKLCSSVDFPVVAKEVGSGISGEVARELEEAGVAAIDVAGAGGTNWIKVELLRNSANRKGKAVSDEFIEWGIPTAVSIAECRKSVKIPIIASGGIRTGLDCAKALALGADLCGMALPLLRPATVSAVAVREKLSRVIDELRTAMFLTGSKSIAEARKARYFGNV